MENGWIKLYRKIIDSSIFQDEHALQLWIYILVSVNHKEKKILFNKEEIIIKPGSGIFGLNQIVSDLKNLTNIKKSKFKKFKTIYYRKLKLLEKLGKLKLQPTNKFTIISVVKWVDYQTIETQVKLKRNSSETPVKTNKNEEECNKNEKEGLFEYLIRKIKTENLSHFKDKIIEFYKYRMNKPKAKQYKTEKGVDGLFRNMLLSKEKWGDLTTCLDIAMENDWQTPDPSYYKPDHFKGRCKTKEEILKEYR